ncbi:MAG: 4-oxalocrotonate tautomerase [Methanosphaera sp. rholeuAM270]|nr:MAG: 4-oxalocrotonate tautomerase [Methanosphaera sp. rholeuAM270]
MPVVTVEGPGSATKEQKKEIIEKVSDIAAKAYDMPVESITVIIRGTHPDNVGTGGKQLSEKLGE